MSLLVLLRALGVIISSTCGVQVSMNNLRIIFPRGPRQVTAYTARPNPTSLNEPLNPKRELAAREAMGYGNLGSMFSQGGCVSSPT